MAFWVSSLDSELTIVEEPTEEEPGAWGGGFVRESDKALDQAAGLSAFLCRLLSKGLSVSLPANRMGQKVGKSTLVPRR